MTVHMTPRWVAALIYAMYGSAGLSFMLIQPSGGLKVLLGPTGFMVWNLLLVIGGTVGMLGAVFQRPRLELVGSPGVGVSLVVYASYLVSQFNESPVPGAVIGFAMICGGASVGVADRALALRHLIKVRIDTLDRIRHERGD